MHVRIFIKRVYFYVRYETVRVTIQANPAFVYISYILAFVLLCVLMCSKECI